MLDEAVKLADKADASVLVHALRAANVSENVVELVVALDGYGNVADGVRKTIELVDALLNAPGSSDLSLASAKVRKA